MLRPQDSATRECRRLDGLWSFVLDPDGRGRRDGWHRGALPGAREMPVPASYDEVVPDPSFRDHVGDAWYQRTVHVPAGWRDRRVVLRFDSATHRATVWVGDTEVMSHEGGYTPFEADVTTLVQAGGAVRITVVVNKELTWVSIPPGEVLEAPTGRRQKFGHDFINHAGLARSPWLVSTPVVHLSELVVTTVLDGGTGTVRYAAEVASAYDGLVTTATLRDVGGLVVATSTGPSGLLVVDGVHPWDVGDGYLYELTVSLLDGDRVVDTYLQPVGIRTVEVRGQELLLNGRPVHLHGFGKHEDAAIRGKGHDDVQMVHDFELMAWTGANSFRTAHYPHAEEVLDLADRRGVLVIGETAAVGLNLPLAGGMIGADKRPTYSPDTVSDATRGVHAQAVRELVERDRHHPSVVIWSIANEPETTSPESRAYFAPLLDLARELDPTRPVGIVNMFLAPPDRCQVTDLCDLTMINRYFGWYVHTGDLAAAEEALEAELLAWTELGKPIIVTEYGADALPGRHGTVAEPWTEEYQVAVLEMSHRVFDRVAAVVGEHVWTFADFATVPGVTRVDGNTKGVFTRDRRPKAAAHALRGRWSQTAVSSSSTETATS